MIKNMHGQDIRIRVERPNPQVVNEKIQVFHKDSPKAMVDPKEHSLYWETTIPAAGTETITHSVMIKAPESLDFSPTAP